LGAGAKSDLAGRDVDGDDLVHEHLGVGLAAEDGADGLGNVGRRQYGEGNLVKQGLKGVVVAAVDYGDVDRQAGKAPGCVEAGKATADDDHAGTAEQRLLKRFGQLAHVMRLTF